jgi:hypothetical protein
VVRMFVRHTVADYDTWRQVYDSAGEMQEAAGVRGKGVYQSLDDPRDITVWHDFDDLETAQAFAGAADLGERMTAAGVQGEPEVWLTQEV